MVLDCFVDFYPPPIQKYVSFLFSPSCSSFVFTVFIVKSIRIRESLRINEKGFIDMLYLYHLSKVEGLIVFQESIHFQIIMSHEIFPCHHVPSLVPKKSCFTFLVEECYSYPFGDWMGRMQGLTCHI